ncbi:hypothetical protein WMF30_52740 [Sorangium sp. So ce134]
MVNSRHPHFQISPPARSAIAPLSEVICWTRIQAEAGEQLDTIIARKELERQAEDGLFFWGVGNAPAKAASLLAKSMQRVDVIFSIMKSKPKAFDAYPSDLYIWRRFVDLNGTVRPLPASVLITSRGDVRGGAKRRHYALMCHSENPLVLGDYGAFFPSAYRNVGGTGAPIGASQVTALLKRDTSDGTTPEYHINMRAKLTGSYWVKLADPAAISGAKRMLWERHLSSVGRLDLESWRTIVNELREGETAVSAPMRYQASLF